MTDKGGEHIGSGLAWLGFWLFLGVGCSEIDINVRDADDRVRFEDHVLGSILGVEDDELEGER